MTMLLRFSGRMAHTPFELPDYPEQHSNFPAIEPGTPRQRAKLVVDRSRILLLKKAGFNQEGLRALMKSLDLARGRELPRLR